MVSRCLETSARLSHYPSGERQLLRRPLRPMFCKLGTVLSDRCHAEVKTDGARHGDGIGSARLVSR